MFIAVFGSVQGQEFMLNDLKINARLEERGNIKRFYKEVLGAEVGTPEDQSFKRDYIQFTNEQRLNYLYFDDDSNVATPAELEKGIWLKIRVDNFDEIVKRIKNNETEIVREKLEQGELYFKAPGGLVIRMVRNKGV